MYSVLFFSKFISCMFRIMIICWEINIEMLRIVDNSIFFIQMTVNIQFTAWLNQLVNLLE